MIRRFNELLTKKQIGIGLLELMLSLAIIAVLLVMATRYYMSASMNSRITQTVDAVMGLPSAAECWSSSGSNATYQGTYQGIDLVKVSYTDKCFPVALVNKTTNQLITPYGDMPVTSTGSLVCVNIKATPDAELQQIAGKICKNTEGTFTISALTATAGFYYEAIRQSCSTTSQCVVTPPPTT
jgi:Tfp pilus assembly protein PilE